MSNGESQRLSSWRVRGLVVAGRKVAAAMLSTRLSAELTPEDGSVQYTVLRLPEGRRQVTLVRRTYLATAASRISDVPFVFPVEV